MWDLLSRRWQVGIVVALALALVWGALVWGAEAVFGSPVRDMTVRDMLTYYLRLISLFTSVITIVVVGIAQMSWRYFWRKFPIIARSTFPDLNGCWEGTIVGDRPGAQPDDARVWITQTLFTMSIVFKHKRSQFTSYSTRLFLEADRHAQRFRIWYSYQFRPTQSPYEGSAFLEISEPGRPGILVGRYFTERGTTGKLQLIPIPDRFESNPSLAAVFG
jgi:hypothetical protein